MDVFTPRKTRTKIEAHDIQDFNRLKLAPVTKSNHKVALIQNEQGQISIFFSASLVVMISIIAFVINIGLFVKAKINLQNATDAAAFSGAAVQARQLTKIAYLNWEMRNIYKEWMYKYYVVGNLNIADVENPTGSGVMNFKLLPDINVLESDPAKKATEDFFNIPTVCIHIAGSKTNICKRYSVPGLPEFGSSNLPGAEEASRAFMDVLIKTKINDCIDRTLLNMVVANTWTYNVLANEMDKSLAGLGPAILSDRQGAWPRAVELALRIRNLEFVMNRPAVTAKTCINGSTDLTGCSNSITSLEQEMKLGNERFVKAFYSGYRNLGNDVDVEMKSTFTLSEIAPRVVENASDANASNLLIPTIYPKQWVDLKLMMVNYAIFYAAMIPRADTKTSGACDISKVAIPVPGYPLGFYKNPDVLTYYAVKGEAEFQGMFNPFKEGAVKLQSYAAAKPFGGRIGPVLFLQRPNEDFLTGRRDNQKFRSVPYITTYDFRGIKIRNETTSDINFIPGMPLPTNFSGNPGSFWLENANSPIGGKLADAAGIQFGVPNLVYDYETPFKIDGYSLLTEPINKIFATGNAASIGLFSQFQFAKFKGNALSATVSPETLDEEIARVRAPTSYEAANYLIPTPSDFNESVANKSKALDSFGFIPGKPELLSNGYERYRGRIYAPLYKENDQTDLLFEGPEQVISTIHSFMKAQETGIKKYKMALNRAAITIDKQKDNASTGAVGSKEGYTRAAEGVSDIDFNNVDLDQMPKTCNSIAGQFLYFYYGDGVGSEVPVSPAGCPKPLGTLISDYFNRKTISQVGFSPTFYDFDLSWKTGTTLEEGSKFMTAYRPGPFTGVSATGDYQSPIDSEIVDVMRRNSYSTKFISLDSLQTGQGPRWDNEGFVIYSEGSVNVNGQAETDQKEFSNPIQPTEDISSIKY